MKNKKKFKSVVDIFLLLIFLSIGIMVRNSSEGVLFDVAVLDYLHNNTNPIVFAIMKFITFVGSWYFLFPVLTIIIVRELRKKKYYLSKLLILSSLGSWIVNFILKFIFNRTRPFDYSLVKQGGLSYPSGHSMVTMSMYLTIAFLLTKQFKGKEKLIYSLVSVFILLMGLSRLYLGVHWPTDIIGGYIGGYLLYTIFIELLKE